MSTHRIAYDVAGHVEGTIRVKAEIQTTVFFVVVVVVVACCSNGRTFFVKCANDPSKCGCADCEGMCRKCACVFAFACVYVGGGLLVIGMEDFVWSSFLLLLLLLTGVALRGEEEPKRSWTVNVHFIHYTHLRREMRRRDISRATNTYTHIVNGRHGRHDGMFNTHRI